MGNPERRRRKRGTEKMEGKAEKGVKMERKMKPRNKDDDLNLLKEKSSVKNRKFESKGSGLKSARKKSWWWWGPGRGRAAAWPPLEPGAEVVRMVEREGGWLASLNRAGRGP